MSNNLHAGDIVQARGATWEVDHIDADEVGAFLLIDGIAHAFKYLNIDEIRRV